MNSSVLAKKSERIQKWDILKFFMIFLVVLGHSADLFMAGSQAMKNLSLIIYTVHMPVFIFISGLFSKKTADEKRYDKMFGYLVLYLALKLIPFAYRFPETEFPGISFFTESGSPWFMLAIFAFNLITAAVKDRSPKYVLAFSIALACFAGYDENINDFLALSRIIVFYPFFYLGYYADRVKLEKLCENKKLKAAAAAVIVIFIAIVIIGGEDVFWFRALTTGRRVFHLIENNGKWGFLLRLAYYAVSGLVSFAVIVIAPSKTPLGFCAKLGQRTLSVYALHYAAIYFIFLKFDCKTLITQSLGKGGQWLIIPISLAVTLFFSAGIFNRILLFIMNIPAKKKESAAVGY